MTALLTIPALLLSNARHDDPASVSRPDGRRTFLTDGPGGRTAQFETVSSKCPDMFDEGYASGPR